MKEKPASKHFLKDSIPHAWLEEWRRFQWARAYIAKYAGSPPLNGQERRMECVNAILATTQPEEIVETGTFLAATTRYFAPRIRGHVFSVEINPYFFLYSKYRCLGYKNVHTSYGDSRLLLVNRQKARGNQKRTFFYLDAHWYSDLPLRQEVHYILGHWAEAVICIDDMRVDDDVGYGYDAYAKGALAIENLELPSNHHWDMYFPAAASADETGARQGAVYIVAGSLTRSAIQSCLPRFIRKVKEPN